MNNTTSTILFCITFLIAVGIGVMQFSLLNRYHIFPQGDAVFVFDRQHATLNQCTPDSCKVIFNGVINTIETKEVVPQTVVPQTIIATAPPQKTTVDPSSRTPSTVTAVPTGMETTQQSVIESQKEEKESESLKKENSKEDDDSSEKSADDEDEDEEV